MSSGKVNQTYCKSYSERLEPACTCSQLRSPNDPVPRQTRASSIEKRTKPEPPMNGTVFMLSITLVADTVRQQIRKAEVHVQLRTFGQGKGHEDLSLLTR